MGKASRSRANTGAGNSKQAQQAERAVRSWFSRTGVVSASNQDQLWSNMAHQIGIDAVEQIQRSIEEPGGRDIYELMYADVETARATATLMAPLTREWLRTWASTELPDGPVLDLGCGWGFSTCFYAAARPDQRVVGVDVSPQAVQCGRALAKELGVTNVEFITCTAADLQLGELFSVITSTLLLVEAEPDRQD